jgi:cob(I)alamin adenosyltransferase
VPRITKVYTRRGDDGTTSLGGGQRVDKCAARVEAFGTVDELNAQIGNAIANGLDPQHSRILREVQNELFHLGADLCTPEDAQQRSSGPRVEQKHIDVLESVIDELNAELGPLENFILPGGAAGAARLHIARTVCRRAERATVALSREEQVGPHTVQYLNRLSDALFVMARSENQRRDVPDVHWDSRR